MSVHRRPMTLSTTVCAVLSFENYIWLSFCLIGSCGIKTIESWMNSCPLFITPSGVRTALLLLLTDEEPEHVNRSFKTSGAGRTDVPLRSGLPLQASLNPLVAGASSCELSFLCCFTDLHYWYRPFRADVSLCAGHFQIHHGLAE